MLHAVVALMIETRVIVRRTFNVTASVFRYRRAEAVGDKISLLTASDSNSRVVTSFTKAYVNPRYQFIYFCVCRSPIAF